MGQWQWQSYTRSHKLQAAARQAQLLWGRQKGCSHRQPSPSLLEFPQVLGRCHLWELLVCSPSPPREDLRICRGREGAQGSWHGGWFPLKVLFQRHKLNLLHTQSLSKPHLAHTYSHSQDFPLSWLPTDTRRYCPHSHHPIKERARL